MLVRVLGLHVVFFMLSLILSSSHPYNFTCPVAGHWKLRAKGYCPALPTDKYYCLYDVIHEYYTEGCRGPDWDRKGSKRVISGSFTRGECSEDRYQPFDFRTNGNSDCVYLKSLCSGEGEMISSNGSGYLDRTCRCDFSQGYYYTQIPKNQWECNPLKEDCSCIRTNNSVIENEWPKPVGSGGKIVIVTSNELSIKVILKKEVLDTRRDRRIGGTVMVVACLIMLIGSIILILYDDEFTSKIDSRVLQYLQSKIYQTDLNEENYASGETCIHKTESDNAKEKIITEESCKSGNLENTERVNEVERQTSMESHKSENSSNSSTGDSEEEAADEVDNPNSCSLNTSTPDLNGEETLKKEEINYLRMVHLIFVVASPLVRLFFNEEMYPNKLQSKPSVTPKNAIKENERSIVKSTSEKGKDTSQTEADNEKNGTTMHLKNGERISDKNNHEHTQKTEEYDIKSMINRLKKIQIISISDRLPLRRDMRTDALIGRILYYRNIIVDAVDGSLSDSEFESYWNELGQTLLRFGTRYLTVINQKNTSKKLKEHLLALSPIKDNDPRLQRYVMVTERFPQLILQQLVREYCEETYEDQLIISFLQDEKHTLFHKRKNQYYCCSDRCGETNFSSIIPKEVWNNFFMYQNNEITHTCKHSKKQKCFLRYEVNFNFELQQAYTSDLIVLVLNIPRLLRYAVGRMYKNSFQKFLEDNKHILFHAVQNLGDIQCCMCCHGLTDINVKAMLTRDNWKKLFHHQEKTCNGERCCCKYSPNNVDVVDLDDTLQFKIFSLTGPFQTFAKSKVKQLDSFLCWNADEKEFIDARDTLVKTLKDSEFKKKLHSQFSTLKVSDAGYISTWILRNVASEKTTSSSKTDLVVMLKEGGKLASKKVTVSQNTQVRSSDQGVSEIPLTEEENNFLKVNYMLMQVVQPVVRMVFDKFIPRGRKLEQVISDIFYRHLDYQNSNNEKKGPRKEHLQLSFTQRERLFYKESKFDETTSKDLDLSLMIRILNENKEQIILNKNEKKGIFDNLKEIKRIRKIITHSPNGELKNEDFDEYWSVLSEFVISQGGEGYHEQLNRLKERPMLKVP